MLFYMWDRNAGGCIQLLRRVPLSHTPKKEPPYPIDHNVRSMVYMTFNKLAESSENVEDARMMWYKSQINKR
jgi:UDP-galactopyranose mutase